MSELNEHEISIIMFATVTFVVIGMVVSWRLVTQLIASEKDYDTDIKSLFWSSIKVLVATNSIEILVLVILWIKPFRNNIMSATISAVKVALIICIGIKGIMLGFCVPVKNESETTNSCSIVMNRVKYSCALCNLFLFAFFVGISIVSTTAMIVVHPILVTSTILCICTTIFSFSVLFAIPNSFESMMRRRITKQNHQKYYSSLCNYLLIVILVIAINSIVLLYLAILSKVDHTYTDSVIQDASSVLPSIIPGMIGWYFAKTKLTARRKKGLKDDVDTDESEKDLEISLLQDKADLSSSAMKLVEDRESTTSDNESELTKLLPNTKETAL